MRIRWGADPYDFDYLPEKLKVEVKWRSRPNPVRSLGGVTHQFSWHDIDNRDFDFLLLVGEHQYVTYLWLVRTDDAHGIFYNHSARGTISCTAGGVRNPRLKAAEFSKCRIGREYLYENCRKRDTEHREVFPARAGRLASPLLEQIRRPSKWPAATHV
jgi:hypothetical protein